MFLNLKTSFPEISISGSLLVRNGDTIYLSCSAKVEANTVSEEITWYKDGSNLNKDEDKDLAIRQTYFNGNITSSLELRNARTRDMGVYMCRTSDMKNIGQYVSVIGSDPVTRPPVTDPPIRHSGTFGKTLSMS